MLETHRDILDEEENLNGGVLIRLDESSYRLAYPVKKMLCQPSTFLNESIWMQVC